MAAGRKTGGRTKGTPNKITKELRDVLKGVLYQELETLPERLAKLDDKTRVELLAKLLPYALPKVQPLHNDYDIEGPISFPGWEKEY